VVSLLRLLPELAERALKLCPPMTAELAKDELDRPDNRSSDQRSKALRQLKARLVGLGDQIGIPDAGREDETKARKSQFKKAA
jgi:hypothetical protein